MKTVLTSAVVAALVSGVVSLLLPYAQSHVDERKEQRAHRRELVKQWREGVPEWNFAVGATVYTRPAGFIDEGWYIAVRPHLTSEELTEFERAEKWDGKSPPGSSPVVNVVVGGGNLNPLSIKALAAIERLEKEWKL